MTEIGKKLRENSFAFALRIVKLSNYLEASKKEKVLSKQVLRSGTSIGANVRESRFVQSNADFVAKLFVALKEAEETEYWLELLRASGYITQAQLNSLRPDLDWLLATLINSIKGAKRKS
jgi:four helix bundle protein